MSWSSWHRLIQRPSKCWLHHFSPRFVLISFTTSRILIPCPVADQYNFDVWQWLELRGPANQDRVRLWGNPKMHPTVNDYLLPNLKLRPMKQFHLLTFAFVAILITGCMASQTTHQSYWHGNDSIDLMSEIHRLRMLAQCEQTHG